MRGLRDYRSVTLVLSTIVGVLTNILIDYYFLDYSMDYYFFFYIFQRTTFNLEEKQKHLLRKMFGSPHTSNQIYLLWNGFSNYAYLKDKYITLKGIGKILFVSVLKILLICKFLNFTVVVIKKIKISKVCIQFSV